MAGLRPTLRQPRNYDRNRALGRPRVGKGAYRINITVEQQLLAKTDRFAKNHGLTRSQLIAHALRHEMAGDGASLNKK